MFRLFLFVAFPILAFAHHSHDPESGSEPQDGPCSLNPPSGQENFQISEIAGRWFGISSNFEQDKSHQCVEIKIEQNGDDILGTAYFRIESAVDAIRVDAKYSPIADQPARFNSFVRVTPDGEYVAKNWTYTIVRLDADNALEYACKDEGNKHIDFYRAFSRKVPISEEADNKNIQLVKDNGDKRPLIHVNHENCQYQLN